MHNEYATLEDLTEATNIVNILMIDGVSEAIVNNGQTKDFS